MPFPARLELSDFGDFGVSFAATVARSYKRRGGPRPAVEWSCINRPGLFADVHPSLLKGDIKLYWHRTPF